MNKLQSKFIRMLFLTSTVPLILVAVVTTRIIERMAINNAQQSLSSKLEEVLINYEVVKDNLKFVVRDQNRRLYTLMDENQLDLLKNEYQKIILDKKLDFLVVTDEGGRVLVSMTSPELEGYNYSRNAFIQKAMRGYFSVSTEILDEAELKRLGILSKAEISGINPARGMVVLSSMPLINNNEIIVGTVMSGYLLNNNSWIIPDKITHGNGFVASMFMDNIRVCSSIKLEENNVLGIGIDNPVAEDIMKQKHNYIGRILVGKEWYMAGYAPLYNIDKKVVGMLGVGIPEKKIFALRDQSQFIFLLAVIFSIVIALFFGLSMGNTIVQAVNKLRFGIEAFGKGDYDYHVKIKSKDELEELADFFNNTMFELKKAKDELDKSSAKLKETQNQLLEYERMAALGRMASVITHELRNIFAGISANASYLKINIKSDPDKALNCIKDIDNNLNYANTVLNNILKLHYPRKLTLSEVDMVLLFETLFTTPNIVQVINDNTVELIKDFENEIPKIKGDGLQLKEAFSILVVNALQAMPQGGKLKVSLHKKDNAVEVSIEDTGIGIPKNVMENLFTPFVTTKSRGLGLGLCISREIIKAHKGVIEANSEINKGTKFTITLPVDTE